MEHLNILTIDDDPLFNKILAKFLTELNLTFQITQNLDEFYKMRASKAFNFYIIDLNLENPADGFDIITKIRSENDHHPIFVLSSEKSPKLVSHAIEIGASDYIIKPIDKNIISTKIEDIFYSKKIGGSSLKRRKVPGGGIKSRVSFNIMLEKVSEDGLSIVSRHLLPKGAELKIDFQKILKTGEPSLERVVVKNNWVINKEGVFGAFLEYSFDNQNLYNTIKTWIKRNNSKK